MAAYTPRAGDTVRVEVAVDWIDNFIGLAWLVEQSAAGKVELVSRAEPDWLRGEIARDIDEGDVYLYAPGGDAPSQDWFRLAGLLDGSRCWFSALEMIGKLERCKVVAE